MGRSSTMLTGRPVGGLAGDIPTKDIPAARRDYLEYFENFAGNDEDKLNFSEFVRQVWKKQKTE